MKKLTQENFAEALKGNSIVFFHKKKIGDPTKDCQNCEATLPHVENFEKPGVKVFEVDTEENQSLVTKYAPSGRWNLPLIVYFENGKRVQAITGFADEKRILEVTKTFQNMTDLELQQDQIDIEIAIANQKKVMLNLNVTAEEINTEIQSRIKAYDKILPPKIGAKPVLKKKKGKK